MKKIENVSDQVFKDVRANKVDRIKEEYRVHRPGKPYDSEDWMEARAFVEQYDEKGTPLIVVGSSLFITERKIAERELIAAKERAGRIQPSEICLSC